MADDNGRQPILPAKRRRLQQCFEHGSKSVAQGSFDYAADMFTQCVIGDPGNMIYAQQFLRTLYQKYGNNKKGSKLAGVKGMGIKGSIKKAEMSKDWPTVLSSGLEMLKLNPWDVNTLTAMATACDALHFGETQLAWLKGALEANTTDPHINRLCGRALARVGEFESAIACWQRVRKVKPTDEEANKAISNLEVEKTITRGGYEDASSSTDVRADKDAENEHYSGGVQLTPEQKLEKLIAKKPEELGNYLELADLHYRHERYAESEAVLKKALDVSGGGDVTIRERLEDAQLHRGRQQVAVAEKKAELEKTEEAQKLAQRMKAELNRLELDVYRSRTERYPTSVGFKFELGLRLKRARQFEEAIKCFQDCRGDTKRQGLVYLELGECFQYIKQHKLALSNYEEATRSLNEREVEARKLAFYRAGRLALTMGDIERADRHLTEVASMDFGFKDVAALLDKVGQMRNKG